MLSCKVPKAPQLHNDPKPRDSQSSHHGSKSQESVPCLNFLPECSDDFQSFSFFHFFDSELPAIELDELSEPSSSHVHVKRRRTISTRISPEDVDMPPIETELGLEHLQRPSDNLDHKSSCTFKSSSPQGQKLTQGTKIVYEVRVEGDGSVQNKGNEDSCRKAAGAREAMKNWSSMNEHLSRKREEVLKRLIPREFLDLQLELCRSRCQNQKQCFLMFLQMEYAQENVRAYPFAPPSNHSSFFGWTGFHVNPLRAEGFRGRFLQLFHAEGSGDTTSVPSSTWQSLFWNARLLPDRNAGGWDDALSGLISFRFKGIQQSVSIPQLTRYLRLLG
eukprot:752060-Hanusia_phi.AAC.5